MNRIEVPERPVDAKEVLELLRQTDGYIAEEITIGHKQAQNLVAAIEGLLEKAQRRKERIEELKDKLRSFA